MAGNKDLTQLGRLVAHHHGWAAAKAFKAYRLTESDSAALTQCAISLLKVLPPALESAAMASAALAVGLERSLAAPVQVVAGALLVEGVPVVGTLGPCEDAQAFAGDLAGWPGHAWVMVGPHLVDIMLFRLAYSAQGPARLSRHVDLVFGPGKALYVDEWRRTPRVGLQYVPQYVLSADQVTGLMGGAFHLIRAAQGAGA